MRVLGISGSLRRESYNTRLLEAAGEAFAAEGAEFEIYEGLGDVPPYNEDVDDEETAPGPVRELREAVRRADAVFFSTPEYNSSVPGHLKNAIDWLSRPLATNALRNRPVAVAGASTGMFGAVWAQSELRKVLAATGARVADVELPVPQAHTRFDDGRVNDPGLLRSLREAVHAVLEELRPAIEEQQRQAAA